MNNWPKEHDAAHIYGNPDPDGNGEPSMLWESTNLVRIVPPWQMTYAGKPIKSFRIHRVCAPSLQRVLGVIWAHAGASQEKIEQLRLHVFGGSYNYRLKRGASTLSMHSYGCALDLDPDHNGLGKKWIEGTGMMPQLAVDAFHGEQWVWGGDFHRPDAMHFQAAI